MPNTDAASDPEHALDPAGLPRVQRWLNALRVRGKTPTRCVGPGEEQPEYIMRITPRELSPRTEPNA